MNRRIMAIADRKMWGRLVLRAALPGLILALVAAAPNLWAQEQKTFDWMPAEAGSAKLTGQDAGSGQTPREIAITKTPKATADISKFTKEYVIELQKFNISKDGTHAVETTQGINQALQYAKTLGVNRIVFPKGTYLISESDSVLIDNKDTIIDLNSSTLQVNKNGLVTYNMVSLINGAENVRLTNGTLRGDRDAHDYKTVEGSHEWCTPLAFEGGHDLEVDHVTVTNAPGYGVVINCTGARTRPELLATIVSYVRGPELEQGAFSDEGAKLASKEKTRSIKPYDITKANGEFEFGYTIGYQGYPQVKSRVYQAYFYNAGMKFIEKQKCLQYRKAVIPAGAKFMNLEFNQPEAKGDGDGTVGRITNYRPPTDVHFHNNHLCNNRTLGIAFNGGRRWLVEENLIEANGPNSPGFGVDFEDGWDLTQDIVFRNNRFKGNLEGDLVIDAGSELLFEGNEFTGNVGINYGRAYNYTFRNNRFLGGDVAYTTKTGVASIHDNCYENCRLSIDFDKASGTSGVYLKPGELLRTPPLELANETLVNVQRITGTYLDFVNSKLKSVRFVAGDDTRLVHFKGCEFDNASIEYAAKGPQVDETIEGCKGTLREEGSGLKRRVSHP
jgi:hypothetical protein